MNEETKEGYTNVNSCESGCNHSCYETSYVGILPVKFLGKEIPSVMCASIVTRGEARTRSPLSLACRVSFPRVKFDGEVRSGRCSGKFVKTTTGRVYNSNFLVTFVRFFSRLVKICVYNNCARNGRS